MPAAIPLAAAVVGGAMAASTSSKASKAQAASARESSDAQAQAQRDSQAFQQRQADQARADNEPWRTTGMNHLSQMSSRMSPGGDLARTFSMSDFQADPGYQFRLAEGQKGLDNSMASRGMALSGAALKATSNYNQGAASGEVSNAYNRFQTNQTNQFNRLASLANVGQVAANQNGNNAMSLGANVGNGMMNAGQQIGNNMVGAGNARASGYLAQGNALTGALNQGVSTWNQYNATDNNRLYNSPNNYGGGYNNDGSFSPNTYGSGDNPYERAGSTPTPWD